MNNLRLNISLLLFLMAPLLNAQDSIFKFKGQADGYAGLNFGKPLEVQTGGRFLPSLSIGKNINSNLKFDSEISFDSYLDYQYAGSGNGASDLKIKPYRLWIRLSTERFELRAGLQKINFGSASALRPLMWFDHLDPRDPLQLTDGVYGLLGRYYFQNNANAWLWVLWGNDKTMGWETIPTVRKIPEFGGRMQFPVPKGEIAVSYNHRIPDLKAILNPALILKIRSDSMVNGTSDPGYGLNIPLPTADSILHISLHGQNYSHWVLTILSVLETEYMWHLNFSGIALPMKYLYRAKIRHSLHLQ